MTLPTSFINEKDNRLADELSGKGYVILPVEDIELLNVIRDKITEIAAKYLSISNSGASDDILNKIADNVDVSSLNKLRLQVIDELNAYDWLRPAYYRLAKSALESIVGNELAMQKKINLSIQMPNDDSSLLTLHADTWSGDSPFEMVVWLPLVNCYKTKSMYILSPEGTKNIHKNFPEYNGMTSEDLYQEINQDVKFIDIEYGNILLFNQCLPHGNRLNEENETRWTMNCRFKGVFTPYREKKLGEFFEPITLKAASRIGMDYQLPSLERG